MRLDFSDLDNTPEPTRKEWVSEGNIELAKIGFFGLVILSIFGFGISRAFSPTARQIRSEIQQQDQQQTRNLNLQQQQQRYGEQSQQIAEDRYLNGCLLVYEQDASGNIIALYKGMRVVDPVTRQPLAEGTRVCDPNGATSVLDEEGKVGVIAVTPNVALVRQLIREGKLQ